MVFMNLRSASAIAPSKRGRSERGSSLVEYSLTIVCVVVAGYVSISSLGQSVSNSFSGLSDAFGSDDVPGGDPANWNPPGGPPGVPGT
jgi:Flp pilus assembly pilin Flp